MNAQFRDLVLILIGASFLFAWGIQGRVLRRASEGRVARVAQEMLDSGDWVVPKLNGQPRVKKPPLSSWLVALSTMIGGDARVSAADALVPVAIASVLTLILHYLWLAFSGGQGPGEFECRRRMGGIYAVLALAMMPAFIGQGRCAELDMWVTLFTVGAFWCWDLQNCSSSRMALWAFYGCLGLGFLIKGPVILVLTVPGILIWSLVRKGRGLQASFRFPASLGFHVVGFLIFLAIVLPWAVPFLVKSGITWDDFSREFLERTGNKTGHKEAWPFYLTSIPYWTLPWFLLLPWVVCKDWKRGDTFVSRRGLWWCWFLANLVLWSCLTAKQRHYAIPWLPPLALLIGDWMAESFGQASPGSMDPFQRWGRRVVVLVVALPAILLPLAAFLLPRAQSGSLSMIWGAAVLGSVLFACAAYLIFRGSPTAVFNGGGVMLAGLLCAVVLYVETLERSVDERRSTEDFCDRVNRFVPRTQPLYDAGVVFDRPQVLFALGRNVIPLDVPRAAKGGKESSDDEFEDHKIEVQCRLVCSVLGESGEVNFVLVNNRVLDLLSRDLYEEVFPGTDDFLGHSRKVFLIKTASKPVQP